MTTQTLKLGSTGRAVVYLQRRLGLPAAGVFDSATTAALVRAQGDRGLATDGIYGPVTNRALTQSTPAVMGALCDRLDADAWVIGAVLEVEAGDCGFHDDGRPRILLERHYVWRLLTPEGRLTLPAQVCDARPGGYRGAFDEWGRFGTVATAVGDSIAVQACSWGLPQIMGANYTQCGCTSVYEFEQRMARDEDSQLRLFANFLASDPRLVAALRARDWAAFAQRYNGPASKGYDAKLAAAYERIKNGA